MSETGTTSLLQAGSLVTSGTSFSNTTGVLAITDGFAVISIQGTAQNPSISYAYGGIGTQIGTLPTWFNTTGGALGQYSAMDSFPNTLCIPIPAGSTWYFYGQNVEGNHENVVISVYWFPMSNNNEVITYEILGSDTKTIMPPPPLPVPSLRERIEARNAHAASFVEQLEIAIDKTIDLNAKRELASLLAKL